MPQFQMRELDRFFNGVAWGTKLRLIAHTQDESLMLVWIPGNTGYVDRVVGRAYSQSQLRILRKNDNNRLGLVLHEGGRLSKAIITKCKTVIDAELGLGAADQITLKETVVVTQNGE